MSYVRSFAPWILYAALSSVDWRIGVGAAAVAALLLVAHQARTHDLDLLAEATALFFVVMTVIALAAPHSGLHHWTPALSAGVLAVVAIVSLAIRRPFTLAIAKRTVPEQFWTTPLFLHSNTVITTAWAIGFTASSVICALLIHHDKSSTTPVVIVQIAAFVVPMVFTKLYSERVRAAGAAAAAAAS
jgi:hypothetical protein